MTDFVSKHAPEVTVSIETYPAQESKSSPGSPKRPSLPWPNDELLDEASFNLEIGLDKPLEPRNPAKSGDEPEIFTESLCFRHMKPETLHMSPWLTRYSFEMAIQMGCPMSNLLWEGILKRRAADCRSLDHMKFRTSHQAVCRPVLDEMKVYISGNLGGGQQYKQLEFYTVEEKTQWPVFGRARHIASRSDSNECFELLSKWLEDCTTSHPHCPPATEMPLPTRVIDVGSASQHPKLHQTASDETGRYVALSYCWGETRTLKTTRETLELHTKSIQLETLPETHQDAVLITRRLGIQYLWIDALCIIQDDHADWELESSKMGPIYRQAYLTIAATKSAASTEGIFSTRRSEALPLELARPNLGECSGIFVREPLEHDAMRMVGCGHESRHTYPLHYRAWTLQERFLSTRIAHYTNTELIWECSTCMSCECGNFKHSEGRSISKFGARSISVGGKVEECDWGRLVSNYTTRKLTEDEDRLPAISAIARLMCSDQLGTYVAGLWSKRLPLQLGWYVDVRYGQPQNSRKSRDKGVPSWSWASVELGDCILLGLSWLRKPIPRLFEVESCECVPSGIDPYGRVASGILTLNATLLRVSVERVPTRRVFDAFHYDIAKATIGGLYDLEFASHADSSSESYRKVDFIVKSEEIGVDFSFGKTQYFYSDVTLTETDNFDGQACYFIPMDDFREGGCGTNAAGWLFEKLYLGHKRWKELDGCTLMEELYYFLGIIGW